MKSINKKELHQIFSNLRVDKEKSFNELYEKYSKLIYAISFSILKNKENSEDIMQTVFTKIYNLNSDKLPTSNEASWLYTLTKNESINLIRKQKNKVNLDDIADIPYDDKELENIIERDAYNKIIKKLSPQEKEIVNLHILCDMKFKDIAKLLNIPIGTVQWKYYTALHSLKLLLSNLSLFIIGITLFIANKNVRNKQSISDAIDMSEGTLGESNNNEENDGSTTSSSIQNTDGTNNEAQQEQNVENEINISQNVADNTDYDATTDSSMSKNDEATDNKVDNSEIQNVIGQDSVEVGIINDNMSKADIWLLSISAIFLLLTIIFSIIYVKHQQKSKKRGIT